MSVDKAMLHLENVFEYGQAYVALSRVRSERGLSLAKKLLATQVKAHPAVVAFYTNLEENKRREKEAMREEKKKQIQKQQQTHGHQQAKERM